MRDTPISFPLRGRPGPFDPPEVLGQLREERPIAPMRFADGHVGWLVTGYSAVRAILGDARFSTRLELGHPIVDVPTAQLSGQTTGPGMFPLMDPPDHTRYRRLLMAEFTVRRMKRLESRIAEITHGRLDAMEAAGSPADLVAEFASPVPALVICELLGVPDEDREEFRLAVEALFCWDTTPKEAQAALAVTLRVFPALIARRRAEPTDDIFSGLVHSAELTDQELATIGYILLASGLETTANMLSLGTFALLCHPEQKEALRGDPDLIDTAVEELVRYLSIAQYGSVRTALEDVEIEGTLIGKGQSVLVSMSAANRDAARFGDPDTLDITRPIGGHIGFGHGFHHCLGQQLARAEMRQAFPALLDRFPELRLAVPPDEVPTAEDRFTYGVHRLPVAW
ncbi:cytochrome P450 [Streptomyces sp. NPDC059679]|uniref:cytochrome P450 n=1 Tax=Streptomyces sp. NPDC059679 TaxID=3346903 RepID=UPI0036C00719